MPTRRRTYGIEESARNDSIPHFTKQVKAGVPGALKSLARQSKKFTPGHDEHGFPKKKTGGSVTKKKK